MSDKLNNSPDDQAAPLAQAEPDAQASQQVGLQQETVATPSVPLEDPAPQKYDKFFRYGPWVVVTGILLFTGYRIWNTFDHSPENTNRISKPPVVQSDVNQDADPVYAQSLKTSDQRDFDYAEKNEDSFIPNLSGSFDPQADLTEQILREPVQSPTEQNLRAQQTNTQSISGEDHSLRQQRMLEMMALLMKEKWQPGEATFAALSQNAPPKPKLDENAASQHNANAHDTPSNRAQNWLVAPGKVFYGQVQTTTNSDIGSPVIAKILSGPFDGENVIGTFQKSGDLLVIKFTSLSYKGQTLPINAYIVNPDTLEFGVADEVDHHYFERLVIPIAASALQGLATGFSGPLTTVNVSGDVVVSSQKRPSTRDQALNAVGAAGAKFGEIIQQDNQVNGSAVLLYSGSAIGIAFIDGVPAVSTTAGVPTR